MVLGPHTFPVWTGLKASREGRVNSINQIIAKFVYGSRSHASLKTLISHSLDICPIKTCDGTREEFTKSLKTEELQGIVEVKGTENHP